MYTGYELTSSSRDKLKRLFPPKYPIFLGHHITEKFGETDPKNIPKTPQTVEVVGYIDEKNGIEGFLVSIDKNTKRSDGNLYHITWSLDSSKGYKPAHTNKVIKNAKSIPPIDIDVIPKFFSGSTQQELKKTLKDYVNI